VSSPTAPEYVDGHGLLSGRSVLITAAAGTGIGFAAAKRCVEEGAQVVISDSHERRLGEAAEQLGVPGIVCDVTDEAQVQSLFEGTLDALGGLDVLINNAGLGGTAEVVTMTDEQWSRVIDVTLTGTFRCTRAALRHMQAQGHGVIVNNASVLGWRAQAGQAHYAAAKAGVIGFTKSLAYEVARDGVTVNAICPGPIETALFRGIPEEWRKRKLSELPIGRAGQVEEIAPPAVLLASEEGAYYIGATMNPNGGDVML
jgi:3-oxoacyl-[acyl-carrier protein] reductase